VPTSGLFSSALAFVAGFSVVFISFGASAALSVPSSVRIALSSLPSPAL